MVRDRSNKGCVSRYRASKPWARPREYARRRCQDPKLENYDEYGGRGIKFDLTMEEARILFERDNGWALEKPSLDRKDPDGHYTFENCRFVELNDNRRRIRPRGTLEKIKELLNPEISELPKPPDEGLEWT